MDELNRGKSNYYNGQMQIELYDDYEHIDASIEYVIENVLQTTNRESNEYLTLQEKFNTFAAQMCNCKKENEPNLCINDDCLHGCNYLIYEDIQTKRRELILNENRMSCDIIYECSEYCPCPPHCYNRLAQFGPRKDLKIEDYSHLGKQYGLSTLASIPKGSFVCGYAGEILCPTEARLRHQMNDANGRMNYIICLNERPIASATTAAYVSNSQSVIQTFIDPSRIGNIGRYLNHSCDPNCEIISIRIDGIIPKLGMSFNCFYSFSISILLILCLVSIGIFAKMDIPPNTELCFDYGEDENHLIAAEQIERKPCHCGTAKCRKFLPNL